MIKMIALDLDGTLAIANHEVLPATKAGLQALAADGVEVVIATGRRYRTTRFVIENLGIDVFAVCNGGSLIKNPAQKTIHSETFDVSPIAEIARDLGLTLFAQRDAHELGGADFILDAVTQWDAITTAHHETNRAWCTSSDLAAHAPEFLVSGVFGAYAPLQALQREIERLFPNTYSTICVPHATTDYFYCEVAPRHIDKWHGLSHLHNHLDIDGAHTCTVGDQLNDVPMVQATAHGFAMSNGHEELKRIASHICGHNEQDGILEVISYIQQVNQQAGFKSVQ